MLSMSEEEDSDSLCAGDINELSSARKKNNPAFYTDKAPAAKNSPVRDTYFATTAKP